MDVRSLPINLLLNRVLAPNVQSSNPATSIFANSSFESLLTEALLKASLSSAALNPQNSSTNVMNSLANIVSSLESDVSSLGLKTTVFDGVASTENGAPSVHGNSLESTNISAADLNSKLKGVLKNTGDFFVEAGKKYQINPALLASIAIHESGNGSSNAAKYKYNVAGMMSKNGLKTYDSIQDSIFDMSRNLRQNYLDKGKTTIADIGAKYAPIGAANDPTNLNNHWVNGVQRYFNTFTKTTDFA
ncbi:glucosaminidase domain-containing protein [Neobacillus sp. 114]|uniref:glucosaminidase domain-containing protein n=1 Tax=Neobacillus sp. 114 TaxID=3048535 RepID=UPI0024C3B751|nr:glucosaminidase domain-containing protein [Neobacillus sp. 114]